MRYASGETAMAHRTKSDSIEIEKALIKVLQLDLISEVEHKLRALTEGTRVADVLSKGAANASNEAQQAAIATLTRLVDKMLATNARVRETLLWLKQNVADLSERLSREEGAKE
jgi:hypothetical protein